jgi:hypothetical protein
MKRFESKRNCGIQNLFATGILDLYPPAPFSSGETSSTSIPRPLSPREKGEKILLRISR